MSEDKVNLVCDVKIWHEIMGHCNDDVLKLPKVVERMEFTGEKTKYCLYWGKVH